tara:strand:+ start:4913 stop:5308 length:396 start_codon:yes stop_codon:yes gene_type:complete
MSPNLKLFFNTYLGKTLFILLTVYFFYQSPIIGIVFIILFMFIKDRSMISIPLDITYKTKSQTPITPISENVTHETGLELLSKEVFLQAKDSNRYSMIQGSPKICQDNDILCLYENDPKAFGTDYSTKKFI